MNNNEYSLLSLDLPNIENFIDKDPLIVPPDASVQDVLTLINQVHSKANLPSYPIFTPDSTKVTQEQFSCVLIVQDLHLLGIFSMWDVMKLSIADIDLSQLKVVDVMTQPVITITQSQNHDMLMVMSLLCQYRVNYLPVVDDEGQLVGLITLKSVYEFLQWNHLRRINQKLEHNVLQYQEMQKFLTQVQENLTIQEKQHIVTEIDRTNVLLQKEMSERQRVTEAFQQSETLYRQLVESQTDVIVRTDLQGQLTFANTAACQTFGRSLDELLGQPLFEFFHPDDLPLTMENMKTLISPPYHLTVSEQRVLTVQGIRWLQWNVTAVTDEMGEVIETQGVGRDITERKQAEQKIREQASLLDITTDAILVRDLKGQILFWNKGAEQLYGWQADEAVGKNYKELFLKEISSQLETAYRQVIECGSWQGELQTITQSGKKITVETRWTLMLDEAGQIKSVLSVDTDITEKKQLQNQFIRSQRLDSLGTLASGIAHDLNNILTPILSSSQMLNLNFPHFDDKHKHMLNIIENNAKRASDMVRQILTFARGDNGRSIALQVEQLLLEIEQTLNNTFPKNIKINHKLSQNVWTILADPTQIHQVLMNLCVNARDAMPRGGTLSISAENLFIDENFVRRNLEAQVGPYVVITVSDTGTGIPSVILERIFEPFFTTKDLGKGTGLGLSTVIGLVKNHGGFVNVLSEVGYGTQFQVYLPAVNDKIIQQSKKLELPNGNSELILIVDDETAILEITKTSLEDYNYRTLTASNGIEAISLYADNKAQISVVVMDMMMPSMDGLTAIRILQQLSPQVKIIGTSGVAADSQIAKTTDMNIHTFLRKPHTIDELIHAIHKALN
ncbi:MAG: PAS domain S-box protein [Trichormus sp. ATA11-4-KO1]|jgi:hypothetical protein|nr:PAS domain S-box protein [Trichormus sp. ATA11-4-KO1]